METNDRSASQKQGAITPNPGTKKIDFETITLKNDVMFSSVFRDPEKCRELLHRILGIQISELKITEDQKSLKANPWSKGIRLDIYAKDIYNNIYDIEMQVLNQGDLALRSRYYHSEMDSYQIQTGQKYTQLKSSIVIFLCSFDPFCENRSIYTFRSMCAEDTDILLDDKRETLFVNIHGDRTGLSPELTNFLDYLETTVPTDTFTDSLNHEVEKLKNDIEWRENYMTMEMKMEERYEAGLAQGITQGADNKLKNQIQKKLAKGKSLSQIAEECEESEDVIQALIAEMENKSS